MNKSTMHLSSTKLVLPWNFGKSGNSSGVFQTYQWKWNPGPFFTAAILIVMMIFTLMPAVCLQAGPEQIIL